MFFSDCHKRIELASEQLELASELELQLEQQLELASELESDLWDTVD